MHAVRRRLLAVFAWGWMVMSAGAVVSARQVDANFVEGECVVRFRPEQREAALHSVESLGGTVAEEIIRLHVWRVVMPDGLSAPEAVRAFTGRPGIADCHLNHVGRGGACVRTGTLPNDTHVAEQWHLQNTGQGGGQPGADIEAVDAWCVTTGDPSVVVAVLDSGIDFNHPEFTGRTLPGYDFVDEDADPTADHPHGILVTGLLAANANNAFQVAGVDHQCTILPVKVLNQFNRGTTIDLAQGLDYCAQEQADIVSMSLINFQDSSTLRDALLRARQAGCILVACAGNGGGGDADRTMPGKSPLTIAIGATERTDERASFSGTGEALDFVAPGSDVITTPTDVTDTFISFSGCSAATPVAAGIVALLHAQDPGLDQACAYALLHAGAEDRVGRSGEDTEGFDTFHGHGRLNAAQSLRGLGLRVEPRTVTAGDVVTTTLCAGQPGGPCLLAVVDVDGVPVFFVLQFVSFDGLGRFGRTDNVPPGLAGHDLRLQGLGVHRDGTLRATAAVPVELR